MTEIVEGAEIYPPQYSEEDREAEANGRLVRGAGGGMPGGCAMEWYSLLQLGLATLDSNGYSLTEGETWERVNRFKTYEVQCTFGPVTSAVVWANDRLSTEHRQRLASIDMVARIDRCRRLEDDARAARVTINMCKRMFEYLDYEPDHSYLHHLDDFRDEVLPFAMADRHELELRKAVRIWMDERTKTELVRLGEDTWTERNMVIEDDDLAQEIIDMVIATCEAYEKACAEEGALVDLLETWEADACAFAEEMA